MNVTMRGTIKPLSLLAVALIGSLTASAEEIKRIPLPASQSPTNADLPFSAAVWAEDTLYVSGCASKVAAGLADPGTPRQRVSRFVISSQKLGSPTDLQAGID
jgi:enamine deaminase RidA (YjgF/YER057c/UK114 family)